MGRRARFVVKKGWSEPAVIFGANVMPPSSLKSQISSDVLSVLKAMEASSLAAHRAASEAAGEDETVPKPRRFQAQGITHAALIQLLDNNATVGLLKYDDELSTLFAQMELCHNSELRAQWLTLWGGDGFTHDRGGGVLYCAESTGMSSFGNVQPDKLAQLMAPDDAGASGGDGLWCRYLFCRPKEIPFEFNEIESDFDCFLSKLFDHIDGMPEIHFKLGQAAKESAASTWKFLWDTAASANAAEQAFLGKMRGYSVRLAGILHILDCAVAGSEWNDVVEIPEHCMDRAFMLVDYFIRQWRQVHAELGHSSLPKPVVKLLRKVDAGHRQVTTREAVRWKICGSKSSAAKVEALFHELVGKWNYGRIERSEKGSITWHAPMQQFSYG